jgi:uncharacterized protein (DUF4415 family)
MSENNTVHVSAEEARETEGETDWERLRNTTDEEIAEAVDEDPDAAPLLDEEWFESASVINPSSEKEQISIRIDKDVLRFFRAQGRGYQSRINKVLRAFVTTKQVTSVRGQRENRGNPRKRREGA